MKNPGLRMLGGVAIGVDVDIEPTPRRPVVVVAHWSDPLYERSRARIREQVPEPKGWSAQIPWLAVVVTSFDAGTRNMYFGSRTVEDFNAALTQLRNKCYPGMLVIAPPEAPLDDKRRVWWSPDDNTN